MFVCERVKQVCISPNEALILPIQNRIPKISSLSCGPHDGALDIRVLQA